MQVTMLEVLQIVKDLPNAKSSGLDRLNGESLKYAHHLLSLLLSIGFTCMWRDRVRRVATDPVVMRLSPATGHNIRCALLANQPK